MNLEHSQSALPARRPAGLYIHVPFCRGKCGYCSFYSVPDMALAPDFIQALSREMAMYAGALDCFDTVYFGGGTPSALSLDALRETAKAIHYHFNISDDNEWTIEVNPTGLDVGFLASLRESGFNRLNIGVQSFNDQVLAVLGRRHNAAEARKAILDARRAGFGNIGLDLIYGVPGQGPEAWMETLGQAADLGPEHLSCYQLTIEPGTPLGGRLEKGDIELPHEDLQYEFFMKTSEFLEGRGYIHYEISNFARGPSFVARHNSKYWDRTPYLGLGPAAHSFSGSERWWNHADVGRYIDLIARGQSPREGSEAIGPREACLEMLSLGLRTRSGLSLIEFERARSRRLDAGENQFLKGLAEQGYGVLSEGRFRPSLKGMAVADRLAVELSDLLDRP